MPLSLMIIIRPRRKGVTVFEIAILVGAIGFFRRGAASSKSYIAAANISRRVLYSFYWAIG